MNVAEFEGTEPTSQPPALQALWWAGRGEWQKAHETAQELETADGSWVHAYLHRVEGDAFNAAYWYRRAGKPIPSGDFRQEWEAIVTTLLPR